MKSPGESNSYKLINIKNSNYYIGTDLNCNIYSKGTDLEYATVIYTLRVQIKNQTEQN